MLRVWRTLPGATGLTRSASVAPPGPTDCFRTSESERCFRCSPRSSSLSSRRCEDGLQAVEAIEERVPDLVFLDVQMRELDGIDVLTMLGAECIPEAIFATA
ncbi:MAG: response regulator [Gemmatimonas sp.]|nr:response regulator [Gemmatimonas sp.]